MSRKQMVTNLTIPKSKRAHPQGMGSFGGAEDVVDYTS